MDVDKAAIERITELEDELTELNDLLEDAYEIIDQQARDLELAKEQIRQMNADRNVEL